MTKKCFQTGTIINFHILRFFKQLDSRHVSSLFRHFQVIILRLVRGLYSGRVLETFVFLDLTKIWWGLIKEKFQRKIFQKYIAILFSIFNYEISLCTTIKHEINFSRDISHGCYFKIYFPFYKMINFRSNFEEETVFNL